VLFATVTPRKRLTVREEVLFSSRWTVVEGRRWFVRTVRW